MKKSFIVASMCLALGVAAQAQTAGTSVPQIQVQGVGKVKAVPDQAVVRLGIENKGKTAEEVKSTNDAAVARVLKYLKEAKVPEKNIQTQRVSFYSYKDYTDKKDYYQASQTITLTLEDLSKYEALIAGVMSKGVNRIDGVEYKTSQLASYQTEARTLAVQEAKKKATDYATALGQKVGKVILVADGGGSTPPVFRPMYALKGAAIDESADQTLAVGEIEVNTSVSISFELE
ncbi:MULTISPECIES: SIMPL domain-containing protein [unclassified Myroides]|uniref:SIMPL domain-containing protein n=1 Tax=unclassified Myroides TaxID=2642485 RepID=UPI003D2F9A0E